MKNIKNGAKVICPTWGNEVGTVKNLNKSTGDLDIKYKNSRGYFSANIAQCRIVTR